MKKSDFDIYKSGMSADGRLAKIKNNSSISNRNKKIIEEFDRHIRAQDIKELRRHKYLQELEYLADWLGKDFDKATVKDIDAVISKHIHSDKYKSWTRINYKQCLKKLYKWLKRPDIADEIAVGSVKVDEIPSECLLTEEDVLKMLQVAQHPRERCLIALHWDAGTRISELLKLQLRDISLLSDGIKITPSGKTGPRTQKLIFSSPYVIQWLKVHPYKNKPDSPLFCHVNDLEIKKNNQPLLWDVEAPITYPAAIKIIKRIADRAGMEGKKINTHAWRKARATDLACRGWSNYQMNKYFGWKTSSKMSEVYISTSGIDVESVMDRTYGIESQIKTKDPLKPVRCPRCKEINEPNADLCVRCSLAFTPEANETQERMKLMVERVIKEVMKKQSNKQFSSDVK